MPPKLIIEVAGNTSALDRSFRQARGTVGTLTGSVGKLGISIGTLIKSYVVIKGLEKAFEGLNEAVHSGIDEYKETTAIQAQTAAALKSTGDIAGVSASRIHDLSLELSNLSGQSDETIQSAENVLLAFTNIRDSAGKGNDIFTQATKTVVDFAARTGKDAPAAALLLGKALQDPAKRVGILARAGVVLTKSQTDFLKKVEQGQGILAAQKILLGDLTVRYQGAAAAAGKTLPGALNILKQRFRDLAGEGVGQIAPSLTKAAVALAGFVIRLSEAQGAIAKFHVATAALRTLAADIFNGIRTQLNRIDWGNVLSGARGLGEGLINGVKRQVQAIDWNRIASTVGDALGSVNWPQAISKAGHAVGTALAASLNALAKVIKSVDWSKVGKAIADGLAIAVAATVKFLASVNWGAVATAAINLFVAAFKAQNALFLSLGKELGKFLLAGLEAGLTAAGNAIEKLAVNIVLKIVEPFTHLPGFLGGGPFQQMKNDLQQTLADMGTNGAKGGQAVGVAVVQGMSDGVKSAFGDFSGAVNAAVASVLRNSNAATATSLISDAASSGQPAIPLKPAGPDLLAQGGAKPKGISADQRNTFFDNRISRLLDQVQDVPTIKGQIAKLQAIGKLITARIAATKDVTRRLTLESTLNDQVLRPIKADRAQLVSNANDLFDSSISRALDHVQFDSLAKQVVQLTIIAGLIKKRASATKDVARQQDLEDQLLSVNQQKAQARQQLQDNFISALQFNVDKAGATKSAADDLAALAKLQSALRAQVKSEGATLDLEQQLFDVGQQIVSARQQRTQNRTDARNATQFKALGLTATGSAVTPGVKALKNELASVNDAISGSFLDTSKTKGLISHIREVLSGGLGAVGQQVRAQVKSILDDLDNQLKNHAGDQTKFQHTTINGLLAAAGLTTEQTKLLKQRLASVGAAGTVPSGRTAAFATGGGVHYHGPVTQNFNGVGDVKKMRSDLDKQARNRPVVRRGA